MSVNYNETVYRNFCILVNVNCITKTKFVCNIAVGALRFFLRHSVYVYETCRCFSQLLCIYYILNELRTLSVELNDTCDEDRRDI